jgi:hypothetical protein
MNELNQIRNPTHTQGISEKYPNVKACATVQSAIESGDCTARELLRKSSERAWNMKTTMSYLNRKPYNFSRPIPYPATSSPSTNEFSVCDAT